MGPPVRVDMLIRRTPRIRAGRFRATGFRRRIRCVRRRGRLRRRRAPIRVRKTPAPRGRRRLGRSLIIRARATIGFRRGRGRAPARYGWWRRSWRAVGNALAVPVASAAMSSAARWILKIASARLYVSGKTARASEVGNTKPGATTATPNCWGISRRTARAIPSESMALATIEPSTQAATLSGWPSMRAASSKMRSGGQSRPSKRSAMATPAVNAAALEPNPLPMGMSLSMSSSIGRHDSAHVGGDG